MYIKTIVIAKWPKWPREKKEKKKKKKKRNPSLLRIYESHARKPPKVNFFFWKNKGGSLYDRTGQDRTG